MTDTLRDTLAGYVDDVSMPPDFFDTVSRRARRLRRRRQVGVSLAALVLVVGGGTTAALSLRTATHSTSLDAGGVGRTVTLTLKPVTDDPAAAPGPAVVAEVGRVLRGRLAVAGLTGSTVTGVGATLTVTAPGTTEAALTALIQPGALTIRQVSVDCAGVGAATGKCAPDLIPNTDAGHGQLPPGTGPIIWTQEQAALALPYLDCSNKDQVSRLGDFTATSWALACGTGANPEKYLLEPAGVEQASVKGVTLDRETVNADNTQVDTPYYEVNLAFRDDSYSTLTKATAGGEKLTAIVVDGTVETAVVNESPIIGNAEIVGSLTKPAARQLTALLSAGPLPYRLAVTGVTSNG